MRRLVFAIGILFASGLQAQELRKITSEKEFEALYPEVADYLKKEGNRPALRLFLIRHGESEGNLEKIAAGQSIPVFLTATGEAQAKEAGCYLAKHVQLMNPHIYCSPSFRAIQTSLAVAKVWNQQRPKLLDLYTNAALLERRYGLLEGMPEKQLQNYVGKASEEWKQLPYEEKLQYRVVPEMESIDETYQRAYSFMTQLARKAMAEQGPQNFLITSHGQVLKALFLERTASQLDAEVIDFSMPNTSILLFEWDGQQLNLKAIWGPEYSAKPYLSWG